MVATFITFGACFQEPERIPVDDGPIAPDTVEPTGPPLEPTAPTPPVVDQRPNIVLILVDDMGWTGPGSDRLNDGNGSDYYLTPALDQLAEDSVTFDQTLASPVCQASRAVLLTGQSAGRTKVYTNGDTNEVDPEFRTFDVPYYWSELPTSHVTLPELLGDAGYATAHFGKWHLGETGVSGPEEHGYHLNVGGTGEGFVTGGSDSHFANWDGSWDLPNLPANDMPFQFMADRLTDEVIAYLGTQEETPKFAMLSHFSVHHPITAVDLDIDMFEALPPGEFHTDPVYAAMQYNVDENLGRLISFLETTPDPRDPSAMMIDNTLVIFTSDNGGTGGYEDEGVQTDREYTSNKPLFGGKSTTWEGGVRVPMVMRWDQGGQGGRIVHDRVGLIDLMQTIADISGVGLTEGLVQDGVSLAPFLTDADVVWTEPDRLLHYPAYMTDGLAEEIAVRESPNTVLWRGPWKLTYTYEDAALGGTSDGWTLYDLEADISEADDVADEHPDIVADMATAMVDLLIATGADPLIDPDSSKFVAWPAVETLDP